MAAGNGEASNMAPIVRKQRDEFRGSARFLLFPSVQDLSPWDAAINTSSESFHLS